MENIQDIGIIRRRANIIDPELPNAESLTASMPLPSSMSLCPGRTVRAVSESGAPKKIAGMASKNVWEMLAESTMDAI
ncbi:MAG: hypothetical protein A4E44_01253 [Methanosaeta sp. PtaB.Bin018]|nr:MAG: hypothetical protein A4E44_01253 [Methanosaeta sp. PtaB.Bin018]